MPTFRGVAMMDGGSDLLRTRAATAGRIVCHIISAYAAADSYATVVAATLGSTAMVAGDFVSSGASGASRVLTIGAKTVTLTSTFSGSEAALHIAIVDTVSSEVHIARPITSITNADPPFASGGTVSLPAWTDTLPQPT